MSGPRSEVAMRVRLRWREGVFYTDQAQADRPVIISVGIGPPIYFYFYFYFRRLPFGTCLTLVAGDKRVFTVRGHP